MADRRPALALGLIVVAYVALGWLYATRVPKWNAPDEPAHFNYVRHLATTHTLPILQPGDYDFQKVEERMAAKFPDRLPVDWMCYESHQPPLYYALAAPVYLLVARLPVEGQVVALRMLSTVLGALGLIVAYLLAREVFPKDVGLALAVSGVMAFIPMRVAMYAAVENDALAELVLSAVLLALVVGLRRRPRPAGDLLVGALLGLALLTKVVAYTAVALVGVAFVLAELLPSRRIAAEDTALTPTLSPSERETSSRPPRPWAAARDESILTPVRGRIKRLIGRLALVYGVAAVLSGWWFVRNALVYGGLDVFGLQRHAAVVEGQPLTGALTPAAVQRFAVIAFRSFWAQFGWMGILVDERIYLLLAVLCGAAVLGLVLYVGRVAASPDVLSAHQRRALALLALNAALVGAGVVAYNVTFLQAQGRYFFPALPSLALLLVLGLRELLAEEHAGLLLGLLSAALFGLTLLSLFRYVIPAFAQ